ncbi:MAG TPA: ferritin-like domain-containing protein [Streptosporangiaceae bacterium]|nr:ferritin-like domain-containing protein [Streptosporangiaceae bacterium]
MEAGQEAGRGRLAQVIATRGGLAAPEAPFVIEHREALIYMLCEAAELEHGIMCQYLFAAFSLKQAADEGLTDDEVAAVTRWRRQLSHVATQEMLHLALVHNLLTAIGAAPHLARPNLPHPASHYPAGVQLALLPFGEQALTHFMFLERPEGMDIDDADGLAAVARAAPLMSEHDIVPQGQDFATVGHLYRSIEAGFEHLASKYGEDWLFVGPPRAQATESHFGWPELVAVTGLDSAQRAIEEILEQGEGPRGDWQNAHFGQFVEMLDEYQQLREANPGFDPVRPVVAANVRPAERGSHVPLIGDPLTARVADLFNVGYEILLQIFERFFAHTEETDAQLTTLADATIGLMARVLAPLGDLITSLPAGAEFPGKTASPSFELFYEDDYLMPHREAAWALLAERLDEAAAFCADVQSGCDQQLAQRLQPVLTAMQDISRTLAAHLPADAAHARLAVVPPALEPGELAGLLTQADAFAEAAASGPAGEIAELFDEVRSVIESAAGPGYDAGQRALMLPRLVGSVLRPLAEALSALPAGSDGQAAGSVAPDRAQADPASRVWEVAQTATKLIARLGATGDCPPQLVEATAALADLACRLVAGGEADRRRELLWELASGLTPRIQAERNGPLLVTNVPRLIDYLGNETRPAPALALCRCGRSSIKPLCDGSHAGNFSDSKDPERVPDRRDSYEGQQLTIFDNRGICQHSGLCTDRLAAVFRTRAEPFVAPSGGRMDEIVRAVRDCPSGALSFAVDGKEAREQVDWSATREPAIEVTKDGPYRVTGSVALTDADGADTERAQGASREHYALCRCGQSQNKPFCSGMHWYVEFRDPQQPPGYEPTLFEWAGGLPGLLRAARFLYEKHIPADPLLAPVFADMPADQPQRLASWLADAFGRAGGSGGSASRGSTAEGGGDLGQAIGATGLTEEQRQRWVALAAAAADDAVLPADPGFRSALSSCLEWMSRHAAAGAATAGTTPRWDWGPGGPPEPPATEAGDAPSDVAMPGPDEQVRFGAHIQAMFRDRDRQSMSFAFDLGSADHVRAHADGILRRLRDGSMPCDGAWPAERIDVFERWMKTGMQP